MIIFSVAMNGSSSFMCFSITFLFTIIPWKILVAISNTASHAKKLSGIVNLLLAESSRVLSNHCVDAVSDVLLVKFIIYLDKDAIRSLLIGFLLYAIADEPICFLPKGSSTSFKF